jgi:hypothetical protein
MSMLTPSNDAVSQAARFDELDLVVEELKRRKKT